MNIRSLPFSSWETSATRDALRVVEKYNADPSSLSVKKLRSFFEKFFSIIVWKGYTPKDAALLLQATKCSAEHMTDYVRDKAPHLNTAKEREKALVCKAERVLSAQRICIPSLFPKNLKRNSGDFDNKSKIFRFFRKKLFVYRQRRQLRNLQIGQEILWDGGYRYDARRNKPGHKIEWVIRRESPKKYRLEVYNTGGGLEYHYQYRHQGKTLYQAMLEIEDIDIQKITSETFLENYYSLRRTEKKKPSSYIYEELIPSLEGKKLPPRDPVREKSFWVKQQMAGSCEMRWLYPLIKARLSNTQYQQWKLDMRLDDFAKLYRRISRYSTQEEHRRVTLEILRKLERQYKKLERPFPEALKQAKISLKSMGPKEAQTSLSIQNPSFVGALEALKRGRHKEAKKMLDHLSHRPAEIWTGDQTTREARSFFLRQMYRICAESLKRDPRYKTRALLAELAALMYSEAAANGYYGQHARSSHLRKIMKVAAEEHFSHYFPTEQQVRVAQIARSIHPDSGAIFTYKNGSVRD